MKTILIPLDEEDYKRLNDVKKRLGLTWRKMLFLAVEKIEKENNKNCNI